jgi:hypothetical protein
LTAIAIYFIILLIVTIGFFSFDPNDSFGPLFLFVLILSGFVYVFSKCCCGRKLSSGAVLQTTSQPQHVILSELGPNQTQQTFITTAYNPVITFQTLNQNLTQTSTRVFTSSMPSAPLLSEENLTASDKLPTYEEAVQQN